MKRLVPVVALAALVVAIGSPASAVPGDQAGATQLLVKFRPSGDVPSALTAAGAVSQRTIPDLGVHVVSVGSDRAQAALQALKATPAVAWAERDGIVKPQEILPNDPFFPQTYALSGGAWGWYQTHTTQAWDVTRGDPSVVVAVLDTGLKSLPDFDAQTVPGWNVLTGTSDTSSGAGAHGTYVAGVVGLALGNGQGNAGYCPGCRIMPVQVGTDSGATWSDLASGITWAADHGARVENLSWAGTGASSTLANAVSYARSKGVVVVAAAGNSNCDCPTYPAATPGVLGVGGTDNVGNKQGDPHYGNWVALAAPESNITAWPSINGAPGYAPVDARAALASLGATDPQPSSAPVSTTPPQVLASTNSGSDTAALLAAPRVGQVLVRGQGAWVGSAPLSLASVQWQRCDILGASCTTVGTSAKYTVQSADTGSTLRVVVAVKNGVGSTSLASPLTLPVGGSAPPPAPPANTVPPTISGTPQDGQTLSATTGTWSGSPSSYGYQWQRCDSSGAACSSVASATTATYALTSADVGATMRVVVTATNVAGS